VRFKKEVLEKLKDGYNIRVRVKNRKEMKMLEVGEYTVVPCILGCSYDIVQILGSDRIMTDVRLIDKVYEFCEIWEEEDE